MTEPTDAPPAPKPASKYAPVDYLFQFITITAGVLIALLINGLVEWNRTRELVAEARATIAREIAANRKDLVEGTLEGIPADLKRFDAAIQFATEMLATRKTTINALDFHLNLAELSSSGWRTAERTGALGHMDYDEVQRYSRLYDFQDLLVAQQRDLLRQLGGVTAILTSDFNPDNPNTKDLEFFRERAMVIRAQLQLHEQMAKRLAENYATALTP